MPRKAELDEEIGDDEAPAAVNTDKVERFVNQWESLDAKIDKAMTQASKDCQPYKDEQKTVVKRAAESGVPKKEFKTVLRERKLRRKADACRGSLNKNQQDTYDKIRIALKMTQLDLFATPAKRRGRPAKVKDEPRTAEDVYGENPELLTQ